MHDTEPEVPTVSVHSDLSQSMLPLTPVVSVQVLLPLHAALQLPLQLPVQVLPLVHWKLQLPPWALQPVAVVPCQLQLAPAAQLQLAPVHVHPGPGQAPPAGVLPQPEPRLKNKTTSEMTRMKLPNMGSLLV